MRIAKDQIPAKIDVPGAKARQTGEFGHAGGGNMKAQFKKANASGARFALVFADEELARGMVGLKSLRGAEATQVERPLADVASWAAELRNA